MMVSSSVQLIIRAFSCIWEEVFNIVPQMVSNSALPLSWPGLSKSKTYFHEAWWTPFLESIGYILLK